jgi:hypothetical protein
MSQAARACAICDKRRPKRYCPGVTGDICTVCCGTEREVTVNCPLECPYLQEAHRRERVPDIDPRQFPNADIVVDDAFLRRNEPLLLLLGAAVLRGALASDNIIDNDVKDALEALVRTYRTLQSGLVYESRPDNPLAARVYTGVQDTVADFRRHLAENAGSLRDTDILGVLAFLQRLEIQHNNGRPKGRAFMHFLSLFFNPSAPPGQSDQQEGGGSLIHMP